MEIKVASISDCGDRDYNEDSIGCYAGNNGYCFVLADGLGGHGKGEVASNAAAEAVKELYYASDNPLLSEMFESAQDKVMQLQRESNNTFSMKTTMAAVMIENNGLSWGHIGDSRIYLFRKHKLITHTRDHSVPQMLVNAGEIKESQIRGHIDRNKLLRVIGIEWDMPRYELSDSVTLEGNERILLCSDGFWEYIDEKQMSKTLRKSDSPEKWLELMKEIVLKKGKGQNMDNYSAICAFIEK